MMTGALGKNCSRKRVGWRAHPRKGLTRRSTDISALRDQAAASEAASALGTALAALPRENHFFPWGQQRWGQYRFLQLSGLGSRFLLCS